jgi:hypothetical protein
MRSPAHSTGDVALTLLADLLGPVEIVAIGPVDSPLPVTGRCSRCGQPTTVYGPAGSPLCDRCRALRTAGTAKDAESKDRGDRVETPSPAAHDDHGHANQDHAKATPSAAPA